MGESKPIAMYLEVRRFTAGRPNEQTSKLSFRWYTYILSRKKKYFEGRREDGTLCYGGVGIRH